MLDLSLGDVHIVPLDDIRSRRNGQDLVSIIMSNVCLNCHDKITSEVVIMTDCCFTFCFFFVPWVTMPGFNSRDIISVCNQPPRSTQPGHPFVGRCNEYQPKAAGE